MLKYWRSGKAWVSFAGARLDIYWEPTFIACMCLRILFTCLVLLLTACGRQALSTPPGMEHDPVWTGHDGNLNDRPSGDADTANAGPTVIPVVDAPIGQVASVHQALRFVILDFPLHPMPLVDQRLFIYRNNQKVGIVKVTGPAHGRTIAADLIEGEASPDDQVRPD